MPDREPPEPPAPGKSAGAGVMIAIVVGVFMLIAVGLWFLLRAQRG